MAVDDEFYMRPGILAMQTFDDDFVPQGSQGTGSARARAKGKAKAKGKSKPDRLLDISLTRTQFTAKLVAQRQFCATAHQQAVEAADAFMRDNEELQNKFKAIQRAGVKEASHDTTLIGPLGGSVFIYTYTYSYARCRLFALTFTCKLHIYI